MIVRSWYDRHVCWYDSNVLAVAMTVMSGGSWYESCLLAVGITVMPWQLL